LFHEGGGEGEEFDERRAPAQSFPAGSRMVASYNSLQPESIGSGMSPRFVFRKFLLIAMLLAMSGSLLIVHASLRGRGRYCGVVIFDRWDTCLLLSGHYITYVSDNVKEDLRPYRGQAMQVDASEIRQFSNPGDALIGKYTIIGPATKDSQEQATEGVRVSIKPDFDRDRAIAFLIMIKNLADSPIQIHSDTIGPTLLGLKSENIMGDPSDGRSTAWITRGNLVTLSSWRSTIDHHPTISVSYSIDANSKLPERFNLNPGESKQVRVMLKVPAGPYQFLVGLGGGVHEGRSVASNAISFHVDSDGTPVLHE
jgi:hypothetical protein